MVGLTGANQPFPSEPVPRTGRARCCCSSGSWLPEQLLKPGPAGRAHRSFQAPELCCGDSALAPAQEGLMEHLPCPELGWPRCVPPGNSDPSHSIGACQCLLLSPGQHSLGGLSWIAIVQVSEGVCEGAELPH